MSRFVKTIQLFDNLSNPILVKELRQSVKGKFLIVVLGLILTIQLFMWWIFTLPDTISSISGESAYFGLLSLFGFSLAVCMPVYTGWRILVGTGESRFTLRFGVVAIPDYMGKVPCLRGNHLHCIFYVLAVFLPYVAPGRNRFAHHHLYAVDHAGRPLQHDHCFYFCTLRCRSNYSQSVFCTWFSGGEYVHRYNCFSQHGGIV